MTVMRKLIDSPAGFVDDMLAGILAAYPGHLRLAGDARAVVRSDGPVAGKVAIATGGGSGHLPLFLGYVGQGLADGCAVGDVFASPSAEQILAVTRGVDAGQGVLYLFGNYGGDVLNFELAAELAADEGIGTATVTAADDVASAPADERERRRGIAGIALLYKIAGALADRGAGLAEVAATTARAGRQLCSMGVALAPCTIPAAGRPTFEVPDGQMEIGMGIHGEPGVRRAPLASASLVARELTETVLADLDADRCDEVAVLVNGLGATPAEELHLVFGTVATVIAEHGLSVRHRWIGEYATSLEMAGASVSVLRLDDQLAGLLEAPSASPFVAFP
jgi:phosphoenolpyruvate---glycerone phosphotransferase subunit DhaK